MTDNDLVARLLAHRTVGSAPREQLEWLAAHGTLRRIAVGEEMVPAGQPVRALYVVLSGHVVIRVDRGAGPRKVMEWRGGDLSGMLPYSRLQGAAPGRVTVEEPTEILLVDRDHFPEMVSRCPEITAICVHVMLDRARRFTSSGLHDEKMVSLGRLAAGLAHELNNPASALARSARELSACVFDMEASSLALGAARLSPEQLATIGRVRTQCDRPGARAALSPIERVDREDAITAWLAKHGLRPGLAEELVETTLTAESLDQLARELGEDSLEFALRSIGAGQRARALASEVEIAASRINKLVSSIKSFTHMDQAQVSKPVDIGRGLSETVTLFGAKARDKSVTLTVQAADGLPPVHGFGGDLNQVWQNLIDNAIDAAPKSGRVEVTAAAQGHSVVVSVVDDGPGVPPEQVERIFEPFFTTKPQGQGTGLGLDIARRLIQEHEGMIEIQSRPGRTEFRVTLPRAPVST